MNKAELDPGSSPTAEFGAFLRSSRGVRGWRQEDPASAIDYSPTHASTVETGRRHPTERLARELDEAFGLVLTVVPLRGDRDARGGGLEPAGLVHAAVDEVQAVGG
ncbi:helix-turn-helix transcriptional regulator [Kitasatospora sp. NPDC094016]|uniref:helix-turn-helix domain-containing protein n=1 Tax=Kitasatospora sp. NPDC094016 TaxID=3154986 RepID=UPI003332B424